MDKKNQVRRIFDSIAYRYDLLNHLLSAGIDVYWRKKAIHLSRLNKNSRLLDVACGTGDFSITAYKSGVKKITGADLSFQMLRHFNEKKDWSKGNTLQMVAEVIPFKEASFTNITVAFGVRNFYDIAQAFVEFRRILEIKGKVTILEFSLPTSPLIRSFYQFYFKNILPLIGRLISKDKEAYSYLPSSVEEFDKNVDLVSLLKRAGFSKTEKHLLTFGIVQIVIAEK